MIGFFIGCIIGGAVGVFTMCCCVAAKKGDKEMNCTDFDD